VRCHANSLRQAGHFAKALAAVDDAAEVASDDPDILLARSGIFYSWRRFGESYDAALRAARAGLATTPLHLQLGWSSFVLGRMEEAEAWMRKAVAHDWNAWEPHFNLAVVLEAQKQTREALESYQRSIEINPRDFECHIGLGRCHFDIAEFVAAEAQFRAAVSLDDKRAVGWEHLSTAIGRQGRYEEALSAIDFAHKLVVANADEADSYVGLASALSEAGRRDEALSLHASNLGERPSENANYAYSHLLLKSGKLREGWHFHEFRWLVAPQVSLRLQCGLPTWNGQDLRSKTILLHVEQGFGDVVQFMRYASQLKACGATVIVRAARQMQGLAAQFFGVDRVVSRDEALPIFDYYVHLQSLPRVFGTTLESIPAQVPYLRVDAQRVTRWALRLPAGEWLKVGLVWAGNPEHANDRNRSLRLDALQSLWEVDGVQFVSLQKGTPAEEIKTLPAQLKLTDLGSELADFSDTAAVIEQLDLVLCVDTAVAHLAGALGKPVWVMLPTPADWRWLEGREDSPWYPTMRLFRQRERGQWGEVIERVKTALAQRVRAGKAEVMPPKTKTVLPQLPAPTLPRDAPGHCPGFSAVAECRDGILQYLPDEPLEGDSIGWYGEYLQHQLALLGRIIRPGSTGMEVGAGVGAHALFLAAAVGDAGHLYLYEWRPVVQRILRQNLGANRIGNVTLMRRELGRSMAAEADAPSPPVSETLDELRLERLDWLKINGSATASNVLEGATDTLWRLRPLLFITVAGEQALAALAERAKEYSYRCWRMEAPLFNADNFNRRENDLFNASSALALLAIPEEVDVDITLDHCTEIS